MKSKFNIRKSILLILAMLIASVVISPLALAKNNKKTPTPDVFDKYLVFMATGVVKDSPDISGFIGGMEGGDGLHFQREIMKRTEQEIKQNRMDAIEFFYTRYGVDVVNDPRITFNGFELSPQAAYRAYTISGEAVSDEGWEVRDGGWIMVVNDPNGITLGGEFAGVHVPQLTIMSYGDYNIKKKKKRDHHKKYDDDYDNEEEEIIIHYRAGGPIIVDQRTGSFGFFCEISSDKYGTGLATGTSTMIPIRIDETTGLMDIKFNTRNVITFPGFSEKNDSE